MSLSERSRSILYRSLVDTVGDAEAVEELMSYFPARDVEEPVTKDYLHAELVVLRAEIAAELAAMRTESAAAVGGLRLELSDGLRRHQAWTIGVIVSTSAIQTALLGLVLR